MTSEYMWDGRGSNGRRVLERVLALRRAPSLKPALAFLVMTIVLLVVVIGGFDSSTVGLD